MQLLIFSQTLDDWTCQNLQFLKSYMMGSSLLLSAPSAFPHHCVNVLGSKISQSEFHQIRLSWLQSLFDRKVYRGGLLHIDLFYYPSEPLSALLKVSLLVGQAGLRGSLKGNLRTAFRVLTEGQTSCTSEFSIQIRPAILSISFGLSLSATFYLGSLSILAGMTLCIFWGPKFLRTYVHTLVERYVRGIAF